MTVTSLLKLLEQLELAMAELYGWYAQVFTADPEMSAFYTKLELEELAHVDLVRFQTDIVMHNQRLFADLDIAEPSITDLLARIAAQRQLSEPPSFEQALRFTQEAERNAAESHYRAVIPHSLPDLAKLIQSLGQADRLHIEAVEIFVKERSEGIL